MKKACGPEADVYQTFNIQPEYVDMSRRPGIGRQWYEDHPECMEYDTISISTPDGGRKMAQSTMTYEEILETQERVLHNRIKNLRREL